MTSKSAHYLTRRGEMYQLRLPVPKALQSKLYRKELRWSLRTSEIRLARNKTFRAVLLFHELCHILQMTGEISKAKSKVI